MNRAPNWDQRDEGLGNFDDYGEDLSQGRRGYKGRGKGRDRDGPYERRTKLYKTDQTSATFFNPYGRAFLPLSNKELYEKVSEGDKKTKFHSELCAGEGTGGNYRVGIGLSRTAECLLAAFAEVQSNNLKKIINEHYYKQAVDEIEKLTPHLKVTLVHRQALERGWTTWPFFSRKSFLIFALFLLGLKMSTVVLCEREKKKRPSGMTFRVSTCPL